MKILLDMRPALDGHAGIPQETRLLFRGLSQLDGVVVEGLLQSSTRVLAKGLPTSPEWFARDLTEDRKINRLARVVVSLQPTDNPKRIDRLRNALRLVLKPTGMVATTLLGQRQPLTRFDPARFKDFVWRTLFARTLRHDDFDRVTSAQFRVARVPYTAMHSSALTTKKLGHAVYPRLDTAGFDVMIAETPYPGRVTAPTRMVVRYHDAIPLLMPHTISDRAFHQASHYHALRRNVEDGAWFACVSDATRRDLIAIFPQAEARSVVIHNMISHHYFAEDSSPRRIPEILKTRRNAATGARRGVDVSEPPSDAADAPLDYLLMVSTIEPRKNHLTLLAAWEQLRVERFPQLQLVIVGMLGWDHRAIVKKFRPWIERGSLHVLEDVPAGELRLLYRHARVTVCPSYGEGFGFSGVEAMRCGGIVAASNLPVHRDVYGDAAEYFSPYSANDLAETVGRIGAPDAHARRAELIALGAARSALYLPEQILPQWQRFLASLGAATESPIRA